MTSSSAVDSCFWCSSVTSSHIEAHFHCPQAFLSLHLHSKTYVSLKKLTFWNPKELNCNMIFVLWRRDGEESRMYLISCTEAYLAKHPTDGYDPSKSDGNLSWLRPSIDQQGLKRDQSLPNGRSHHVSTHRHTLTAFHFISDMFFLRMRYI